MVAAVVVPTALVTDSDTTATPLALDSAATTTVASVLTASGALPSTTVAATSTAAGDTDPASGTIATYVALFTSNAAGSSGSVAPGKWIGIGVGMSGALLVAGVAVFWWRKRWVEVCNPQLRSRLVIRLLTRLDRSMAQRIVAYRKNWRSRTIAEVPQATATHRAATKEA